MIIVLTLIVAIFCFLICDLKPPRLELYIHDAMLTHLPEGCVEFMSFGAYRVYRV